RGLGHFLGDAGLFAVGRVLRQQLDALAQEQGIVTEIGNAGGEFYITFAKQGSLSQQELLALVNGIIDSAEFRQAVIGETLNALASLISPAQYADVIDKLRAEFKP
ncbi:hypothetical protein RZS08_62800, partial [Arthrospira platensis SPKY1]|nr:hypothetical protein [Arthrospira platensis SPKY1]